MHAMLFNKRPSALKCPSCGGDVEAGWKYCLNCGIQLNGQSAGDAGASSSMTKLTKRQQPFTVGGLNVVSQLVEVNDTGFHTGSAGDFVTSPVHTGTSDTEDSYPLRDPADWLASASGTVGLSQQDGGGASAMRIKLVPLTNAVKSETTGVIQYASGDTSVFGVSAQADEEVGAQEVTAGEKHFVHQADATHFSRQESYVQDSVGTTVFGADVYDPVVSSSVSVVRVGQFKAVGVPDSSDILGQNAEIGLEQKPDVRKTSEDSVAPVNRKEVPIPDGFASEDDDPDSPTLVFEEEPRISIRRLSTGQVYECKLPTVLGKGTRATLMLSGNRGISRRHAVLFESEGHYVLKDNDSSNGTFVNEQRLGKGESAILEAGDIFRLANEEFEFLVD